MEKVYITALSILFAAIIGMVSWWIKNIHTEVKELIKEMNELKQLISAMKSQVEKSIEIDIQELKEDIRTLYKKTNANEKEIAALKQKRCCH